jgi:transcription antitermination factor NusG
MGPKGREYIQDMHHWYAVRVRSRCEKSVAHYLQAQEFEACSAVAPQRRLWSDRVQTVELPLFSGYIFVRFDPVDRAKVLRAPGVVSIVGFGSDYPVDETEMNALLTLLASGEEVQRTPFMAPGTVVRVLSGAFKGAVGALLQVKTGHRLVVGVSLLQRSVSVEIDEAMVEPMPTAKATKVAGH